MDTYFGFVVQAEYRSRLGGAELRKTIPTPQPHFSTRHPHSNPADSETQLDTELADCDQILTLGFQQMEAFYTWGRAKAAVADYDDYLSFFAPFKAGGGSSKGSPLAFASWRRRYQASQSWCAAALPLSSPSALLCAAIFARLALNL